MNNNESYIEAQRIFSRCCQILGVSKYDEFASRLAKDFALFTADEIVRTYPCGCEYDEAEFERKKAYWIDVKYEITKL
jgi:hypothetical protein